MSKLALTLERILVYVWCLAFPWQTIWIYRTATLNGSNFVYGTLGLYASELVLWVLFSVSLFNFRKKVVPHPINRESIKKYFLFLVLFCAFPLYVLLNAWWSLDLEISLRHALFIIEGYMLFTTVVISSVSFQDWVRAFLIGSSAPIVLGLFQWFTQSAFASTLFGLSEHIVSNPGTSIVASEHIGRWLRAYGAFPHPNIFGGYLVFILFCTFVFKLYAETLRDRVLAVVVHTLAAFTVCTTFSRSAVFAYVFVLIGFFVYALRHRFRVFLPLFVATILTIGFFGMIYRDLLVTRAIPVSVSETRSISERADLLYIARELYRERLLFGFGGGVFTHAWYSFDRSLPGYTYQPVHVALLVAMVEYGSVGALLLSISFFLFIWFGNKQSDTYRILYWFGGVLPVVSISFLDHYFITVYPGILIFFAYCSVVFRFSTSSPQYVHKM